MCLDSFVFIIPIVGIGVAIWFFSLRPISIRYEIILNRLLAKEIARAIYKEIDYSFEFHKSCTDSQEIELVNVALEEFKKLQKNRNPKGT